MRVQVSKIFNEWEEKVWIPCFEMPGGIFTFKFSF